MRAEVTPDHRALADFVVIGARLMELKSRALLPAPLPAGAPIEEEDSEDLVEMLLEYQRFKAAASLLREREEAGARAFPRLAVASDVPELPGLSHVTLDRLLIIVQRALARSNPTPEPPPLQRPQISVRLKMAEIRLLLDAAGRINFAALIESCVSREEIITCFMAVLELIKSERLLAVQESRFADILLVRGERPAGPEPPEVNSEEAQDG
jgi:segregation and condensation protein A